ncbi:MAG TPA: hypothetical protein VH092_30085 [Urbifossiella sp.]|jgi:hypothetical protein|nr:hypothetical protein [Urbifossiella sp.]
MARRHRVLIALVLTTLAASALAAPVPEDAKAPLLFYPTKVGTKWVYEHVNGITEPVVVAAIKNSGRELVVSRAGEDGNESRYTKVIVSSAGLRQEQDARTGQPAAVWLLKTPFRAGDTWAIPEEAGGGKRTVYGPEQVVVPAGRFLAAKVVFDRPGGFQMTSWFAPGVGEVKRVERQVDGSETVTRSLKSFTPGKQ